MHIILNVSHVKVLNESYSNFYFISNPVCNILQKILFYIYYSFYLSYSRRGFIWYINLH